MTSLAPGATVVGERYRLERVLGIGGMASVWLARDERLGRTVAIKVIADNLAADRSYVSRFHREARIAAGLSHPNLIKVFDYAAGEERPLLVMEYVRGGTLADRLEDQPAIDADALARDLLAALAHIHQAGIVHRDVKPANVLIDEQGSARLTDFGIAHPEDATRLTQTGQVIGTLRYIAPEVMEGGGPTPLSDLYACGVLLRECGGDASPELGRLIEELTAQEPAERPPSASAALERLDARRRRPRSVPVSADPDTEPTRQLPPGGTTTTAVEPTAPTAPLERLTTAIREGRGRSPRRRADEPTTRRVPSARAIGREVPGGLRTVALAAATLALAVVVVIVVSGTGDDLPPGPFAPPDEPPAKQLEALDRAISAAASE